ncbi:MAG TPA: hypothetical protein PLP33_14835 [Leptospiraceae bacterium]|nr:hypothetical protein [Leptospiraceae bacterium]
MIKFRLHIKNNDFGLKGYFLIQIWDKKQDMVEHTQYNAHAVTVLPYTPSGNNSKIITLNFWVRRLGIEYVIHELSHALLEWSRRNNLQVQAYEDKFYRDEELFCQILGELSQQFYRKLYKLGLTEQQDFVESRAFRKNV